MTKRYGIIDIGSNSIRLVIYEKTEHGAHRVVDGSKRSARLSSKINEHGALSDEGIMDLIETLQTFMLFASSHKLESLLAIATAAIRNASNQAEIITRTFEATGLGIRVLTGEEEAEFGFLGMINSLSVQDGFLLDIGGGSSELTLFLDRKMIHSFSFPFGCVSFNKKFDSKLGLADQQLQHIQTEIRLALSKHDWITRYAHLPLIAVGGTARALGKIHQASIEYPFTQTHNYPIHDQQVTSLFNHLRALPQDKRKKEPGLSKDRADVIVPGFAILTTIFKTIQATHYLICGAGLRDGVFHKLFFPEQPLLQHPLAYSVNNILALHTAVPKEHVEYISSLATKILIELQPKDAGIDRLMLYLETASKLHRIGATIDYYDYSKHTFYLIVHSHLNGLTHKEILIVAAIASYKSKSKTRNELKEFNTLISAHDFQLICKLGMILQLAAALDKSETQSIDQLRLRVVGDRLVIAAHTSKTELKIEQVKVQEIAGDFKKQWGIKPVLTVTE